jgi:hypothetical protein
LCAALCVALFLAGDREETDFLAAVPDFRAVDLRAAVFEDDFFAVVLEVDLCAPPVFLAAAFLEDGRFAVGVEAVFA